MEQFLTEYKSHIGTAALYVMFGAISVVTETKEVLSAVFILLGCITALFNIVLTGRKIFPGKKKADRP